MKVLFKILFNIQAFPKKSFAIFRRIIDGKGARTVFNGHTPLVDKLYTKSNHYISGIFNLIR